MAQTNFSATIYNLWNNNFDGTTNAASPFLGMFQRAVGYVYEPLLDFDISALPDGSTINSAYVTFSIVGQEVSTQAQIVYLYEQDKTSPAGWSASPVYDDFAETAWATELSNVAGVLDNNTYTINDTGNNIRDLVQSWHDNSANNWGMVLSRTDNTTIRYVEVGIATLYVDYDPPSSSSLSVSSESSNSSDSSQSSGSSDSNSSSSDSSNESPSSASLVEGNWGIPNDQSTTEGAGNWTRIMGGQAPNQDDLYLKDVNIRVGNTHTNQVRLGIYSGGGSKNSLLFNGSDEYAIITGYKGISGSASRTIEAWIKVPTSPTFGTLNILTMGVNVAGQRFDLLVKTGWGGTGALTVHASSGYKVGHTDLRDNQWHHVAVSFLNDGSPNVLDSKLYVDGVEESYDGTLSVGINTETFTNDVLIGKDITADVDYFEGYIDEVRLWDDARTAQEISDNMSKVFTGSEANLVGLWLFNESSGTTLSDETSNGYDGALQNTDDSNWVKSYRWPTSPEGATLLKDFGQTSGTNTNEWLTLNNLENILIPKDEPLWIAIKSDSGFIVKASNPSAPVMQNDFQTTEGRWDTDDVSNDPDVAFLSTWPTPDSTGSFDDYWYATYLSYGDSDSSESSTSSESSGSVRAALDDVCITLEESSSSWSSLSSDSSYSSESSDSSLSSESSDSSLSSESSYSSESSDSSLSSESSYSSESSDSSLSSESSYSSESSDSSLSSESSYSSESSDSSLSESSGSSFSSVSSDSLSSSSDSSSSDSLSSESSLSSFSSESSDTCGDNIVDSGKVVVTSETTDSAIIEDIDGLSIKIKLEGTAHIYAAMSLSSSADIDNSNGFFAININGIDSPIIEREHVDLDDKGSVGVVYRTASTLPAGTYTVKGRWYVNNSATLTGTSITLVAIPMETCQAENIISFYDTVSLDTTTSSVLEDIDGLSQVVNLPIQAKIFNTIAVSTATDPSGSNLSVASNIDGELQIIDRTHPVANFRGSVVVADLTDEILSAGNHTVKGQMSTTGTTGIVSPAIMAGFATVTDAGEILPSEHVDDVSDSTAATSIDDIDGLSLQITINENSNIFAAMALESSTSVSDKKGYFTISINGVDYELITRTHITDGIKGAVVVFARTDHPLPAGTYTVKGRYYTDSSNTLSITNAHLTAIGMHVQDFSLSSMSSDSSESSESSKSSDSSKSSESSVSSLSSESSSLSVSSDSLSSESSESSFSSVSSDSSSSDSLSSESSNSSFSSVSSDSSSSDSLSSESSNSSFSSVSSDLSSSDSLSSESSESSFSSVSSDSLSSGSSSSDSLSSGSSSSDSLSSESSKSSVSSEPSHSSLSSESSESSFSSVSSDSSSSDSLSSESSESSFSSVSSDSSSSDSLSSESSESSFSSVSSESSESSFSSISSDSLSSESSESSFSSISSDSLSSESSESSFSSVSSDSSSSDSVSSSSDSSSSDSVSSESSLSSFSSESSDTCGDNIVDSGKVVVTSETTDSITIEDIDGLSIEIKLEGTSHIYAAMSLTSSTDVDDSNGFFAININGTDSPVIERKHVNSDDKGSAGVVYRTVSTLPAGTYTVKGRWYTESSATLTGTSITLVAIPMETCQAENITSFYDTVSLDTTGSSVLEDIDGLSQVVNLAIQGKIFNTIAASTVTSPAGETLRVASSIDDELQTIDRTHSIANDRGAVVVTDLTDEILGVGNYTVKGQMSTTGTIGIVAPVIMAGFATVTDAGEILPAEQIDEISDSTTATSIDDIDGLSLQITINERSNIFAAMVLESSASVSDKNGYFAISIDGVDYELIIRTHTTSGTKGAVTVFARTDHPLSAGTYTVKGRYYSDSGNTLSVTNANLTAIGMHVQGYSLSSMSSSSSESSASSESSISSCSLEALNSGQILTSKVESSSESIAATSIGNINHVSTCIKLFGQSHIMAWLSLSASVDTANKKGYFAISINDVDSRVIAYHFTDADYKDSIGVVFRTASTLPLGTYSVKARWYTQGGVVLSGENISLIVMAVETFIGNPIPSTYKAVASDSTSSITFEDIDGSSDNIALNLDSHVVSFLTGAISSFNDNANITTGINIDGESTSNELLYENAVKEGINIAARTTTELAEGSNNIKGEWLTDSGNIATGDPILIGSIGLESSENYSIPSMRDFVSSDSTISDSIEDIDGLSDTVTLTDESHIFAAMTMASYSESAEKNGIYYININGTDYLAITKKFKNADDRGSVVVYARTDTRLPAGTYTVKGRWETDNGNTLYGEDISLIAFAAETEFTAISSFSSNSSLSLSSESSSSSQSSDAVTSDSSFSSESSSSESDSSSMSMDIKRTYRTSIPDAGITLYGIVDVISDKSIVVQKTVGPTGNVLKGEVVVIDGAGKVKTAATGAQLGVEVCGIAISSAIPGTKVSILRSGKARIVYSDPTNLEIGAPVKCADDGMVVYSDDSNLTIGRVLEMSIFVSFLGKGYLDIELDLLGAKI